MTEHANYQLAFILPDSRQVLGLISPRGAEFPTIKVSLWERPVQTLTERIYARWRVRAVVLDILAGSTEEIPCAVIEVQSRRWEFERAGFSVLSDASMRIRSLADSQREALASIMQGDDSKREPLARIGWIERTRRWIQESVSDHCVVFGEDVFHVGGCAPYALIRFEIKEGPDYWLKATGWPNTHELCVTKMLTQRLPGFLPSLIATRQDWNAWVAEDAGPSLRDSTTMPAIERAIASLASLQQLSTSQIESLSVSGCIDCSIERLEVHVDELVDYLDEAMRQQTSTKAERLDGQQLCELRIRLHQACCRMIDLEIPDSLINGDINPGNILWDGTRCVFIDWAEAYIGNPFLNFEQFANHLVRQNERAIEWIPQLRKHYRQLWRDLLTESSIDGACALAPLLAIATCLFGRGEWLRCAIRNDANFQALARSLARRMHRAAMACDTSEALCL